MKTCKWSQTATAGYIGYLAIGCCNPDRYSNPANLETEGFAFCPFCGGFIVTDDQPDEEREDAQVGPL